MKKLIFGLSLALLTLLSCKEPSDVESASLQEGLRLQKQILSAEHYADSVRNWYFSQANPQQRFDFWYNKIQIDMDHMQLTGGQRAYVLEIFDQISPTDFNNGQLPSQEFTKWVRDWLSRAGDYQLSKNQMGQFVFSLSPAPMGPSVGLTYVDVCNCASDSDWCDFLNGGPSSECNAHCDMEKSSGCGTFLRYECDKDCTF